MKRPRDRSTATTLLRAGLGLAVLAFVSYACGEGATRPPVPGPGTLSVRLDSPAGPEGAARFRLVGGGVGEVTVGEGRVFIATRADTTEVIVVRESPGELRFLVALADTTEVPALSVVEVAGPDNTLRALGGYFVVSER